MSVHPDFRFIDAAVDLQAVELYAPSRLPFGMATRLPRRAYTSQIFQELENEAVWTRNWVCIGSVHEIELVGDLLPYTIGDHAIHVQRQQDGSLIGRFNKAQHGGCRSVPAQCRTGRKTKCSYTSCGHSRDRAVIPGSVLGETASLMGQYLGGIPERLLPVKLSVEADFIFANIDPSPDNMAEVPALAARGWRDHRQSVWREHRANWKLTGAHLVDTARTDERGALNHVEATWYFPNLICLRTPNAMAAINLQPTATDQTVWRVSLSAAAGSETHEADYEILTGLIDRAAALAELDQDEMQREDSDNAIETAEAAWTFNQIIIDHLTRHQTAYWNAPMFDATVMSR